MDSVHISHKIFKLLSPIFHLSRITCLQPLQWKKQDSKYVVKKSKFYVAYSCFVGIFVALFGIYGLSHTFQLDVIRKLKFKSSAETIVSLTDVIVVISTFCLGVMTTLWKVDKYLVYLHHISQFDHILGNCAAQSRVYSLLTYSTVTAVLLLLTYDWISWIQIGSKSENACILAIYLFPYHAAYFAIIVIELIYWHFVYCIKIRLVGLNKRLRQLRSDKEMNQFVEKHLKIVTTIVEPVKEDECKEKLSSQKSLERLMVGYESLSDAAKLVNDCYGLIILIIIFGSLIHLLVTPFAIREFLFGEHKFTMLIVQCLWILLHISRILLVIEPCHYCVLESKETAGLVAKLLLSADADMRKSLELFLSLLSQNKIEFSAFGLTSVDRTLIPAITGAVTTYLVILFQFN